ncbi:MAG: Asp23/Gls24 family envelope stress response protein [Pelotomaculaceae bacterium]|uniref:Asp23/Gls24 family envelope stress response protein n=1 Tax=anaerobic digester metagenome TaxID=1263854 RepID=A0A485M672_9ZZZZ|nr:Asp23/Gls24 family envelope stress response protein [Bacillota bacterium]HHU85193.1 Asp23/Gls24 family envelope stress response protein [Peptococcaceae bacterium]
MEVFALVGPSGTGKSHRATIVAHQLDAQAIIDDGLLIQGNRILAGISAKRQPTRIGAIKSALFMDDQQANIIKSSLSDLAPGRILILGTSEAMTERIAERLGLPAPSRFIRIEEVASEKEMRKAKYLRTCHSKHVIPAPTLEVKKSFPGTLVDPLQVFLRKKGVPGKKDWLEQSMIRPTFTYHGKLTIANSALTAIAGYAAASVGGVSNSGKITIKEQDCCVFIDIAPTFTFGCRLHEAAAEIQQRVKEAIEDMTGLQVKEVNVIIKKLSFLQDKTEATG